MDTGRKKKLPVGVESFEEIRREGFYYVDKTAMIRDLLDRWSKVNLFTRPRRFGKSLNMSMLKAFFEIGCDKSLFEGLKIWEEAELCERYMGRFPVLSISLKSVGAEDFETAREMLVVAIDREVQRLQYLMESDRLSSLLGDDIGDGRLCSSLQVLSRLLYEHHGQKAIILIDEYDVPLAKAHEKGYYRPMVTLIRNLFDQTLKTNDSLYLAVLTGCLRVAKESIFTGLNNPKVFSITSVRFDEYFGFTDDEAREMLRAYGLEDRYQAAKDWYDGYRFGNEDVYCPWDVINYCDDLLDDPSMEPKDYWSNTSGNDVVRRFIEKVGDGLTKGEIEALVAGETVTKEIHEDLTYDSLYDTIDHIWSVLFTTGYLTQRGKGDGKRLQLAIPNREIRDLFTKQIMAMFKEETRRDGELLADFCQALKEGNVHEVERLFNVYLGRTISIRDTFVNRHLKENLPSGKATTKGPKRQDPSVCFYHGILLGILSFKSGWYVRSNQEAGDGYSDIQIQVEDEEIGIIIEVKYAEKGDQDLVCARALDQIEARGYAAGLEAEGFHKILKYGIACFKKKCRVVLLTNGNRDG